MIIVVPTDISCISVTIIIILHMIIIQIILSLSVLPISSFYIYVLRCMAVYSTISQTRVMHVYIPYVRKSHTAPVLFNLAFYLFFHKTNPNALYMCAVWTKRDNNSKPLALWKPVAPHMMLHQELDDCCMKGCTSSTYSNRFRDDILSAKIGGMKSQEKKTPSRTVKILMKANTHHHTYINYLSSRCAVVIWL